MKTVEAVMPSGAVLTVTPADFDDVMELKTAVGNAIGKIGLPPDIADADISLVGIFSHPAVLSEMMDKVKSVAISKEVRAALFRCFRRVQYDNMVLTKDLFDDPNVGEKLRRDYFSICWKVIETNLKPFFEQTFSAWREFTATPTAALRSQ